MLHYRIHKNETHTHTHTGTRAHGHTRTLCVYHFIICIMIIRYQFNNKPNFTSFSRENTFRLLLLLIFRLYIFFISDHPHIEWNFSHGIFRICIDFLHNHTQRDTANITHFMNNFISFLNIQIDKRCDVTCFQITFL